MITDKQYLDLQKKYEELNRKYAQMSRDIATIKMRLDISKNPIATDPLQTHKDTTRYYFMGKQLNKRQLVLQSIKQYVADNNITDPKQLFEMFPDYIQGSLGVIRLAEEAERYSNATEHYFFKDEEVLSINSSVYVVSKDWTVKNIGRFIKCMETAGYEIKQINRI